MKRITAVSSLTNIWNINKINNKSNDYRINVITNNKINKYLGSHLASISTRTDALLVLLFCLSHEDKLHEDKSQ